MNKLKFFIFLKKILIFKFLIIVIFMQLSSSFSYYFDDTTNIQTEVYYENKNRYIDANDIIINFLLLHPECLNYFLGTKFYKPIIDFYENNKDKIKYLYYKYLDFTKNEFNFDISNIQIHDPIKYFVNNHYVTIVFLSPLIDFVNENLFDEEFKYIKFNSNKMYKFNNSLNFPDIAIESLLILNFLIYLNKNHDQNLIDNDQLINKLVDLEYSKDQLINLENFIKENLKKYIQSFKLSVSDFIYKDNLYKKNNEIIIKINFEFNLILDTYFISPLNGNLSLPINKINESNLIFVLAHEFSHYFTWGKINPYNELERNNIKGDLVYNLLKGKFFISKSSNYNKILYYFNIPIQNKDFVLKLNDKDIYFELNEIIADLMAQIFYYSKFNNLSSYRNSNTMLADYEFQFFIKYPEYLKNPELFSSNLIKTTQIVKSFTQWYIYDYLLTKLKFYYLYSIE